MNFIPSDKEELLVLVNEHDEVLGTMEKMEVHRKALLHRAFSVFLFNQAGEMLLQQRAFSKYHSGGLWTNTCCSHPYLHETAVAAGIRRTKEELGITVSLRHAFSFIYKAALDNELTEHEFDHVLVGQYDGTVQPNADEVHDVRFQSMASLRESMATDPSSYTVWFNISFPMVEDYFRKNMIA